MEEEGIVAKFKRGLQLISWFLKLHCGYTITIILSYTDNLRLRGVVWSVYMITLKFLQLFGKSEIISKIRKDTEQGTKLL